MPQGQEPGEDPGQTGILEVTRVVWEHSCGTQIENFAWSETLMLNLVT